MGILAPIECGSVRSEGRRGSRDNMRSILLVASALMCLAAEDLLYSKPFQIQNNLDAHGAVHADIKTSTGVTVRCSFKYNTLANMQYHIQGPSPEAAQAQARDLLDTLTGVCITGASKEGYWQFQVCVGREVVQFHDQER